jgi:formate/nitrite transporter FocA (FNT family)
MGLKLDKSALATLTSGVLANILVCLTVWMAMFARTLSGKVAVIIGPVAIFVAAGFEHSIANMSLLPIG